MKVLKVLLLLIVLMGLVACPKKPSPPDNQLPGDLYCATNLSAVLQVKFAKDLTFRLPKDYPTIKPNEYCSIAVDEVNAVNQKIFNHFGFKQTPSWREIKQHHIPCYAQDWIEEAVLAVNPGTATPIEAVLPTKHLPDGRYQIEVSSYDQDRYYPDVIGLKGDGTSDMDQVFTWTKGLPPGVYVVTSSLLAIWATVPIVVE